MRCNHKTAPSAHPCQSSASQSSALSRLTRRRFLGLSIASLASLTAGRQASRVWTAPLPPPAEATTSLAKAYVFLNGMMDRYGQGNTIRLSQSFVSTKALKLADLAFTYDNALMLVAYLQRGHVGDITRASVLGDSLVYGQAHDPNFHDGRLRDGYHSNPYVLHNGQTNVAFYFGQGGSATGNQAWAGLALAHLYHQTNKQSYLDSAVQLATWIQANTYDTRGAGGYKGGVSQHQHHFQYKSTEENIDTYTLFTFLAQLTNDPIWSKRAQHAFTFVQAMWNSKGGFFWTGTDNDGITINTYVIPEDIQSWSYLALHNPTYAASLDWAKSHLAAHDGKFSGVSFGSKDTSGVWFEGTSQMAAGLFARNASGDQTTAITYLENVRLAQASGPHTDHKGIIAASHDGLRDGFGDKYYAALHTGATSWYCIARQRGNPFSL